MSEKRKRQLEVTFTSVYQKDTAKGPIFIGKTSDGIEVNTKDRQLALVIKENIGKPRRIDVTELEGRLRDDGSRWPSSYWLNSFIETAKDEPAFSPDPSQFSKPLNPDAQARIAAAHAITNGIQIAIALGAEGEDQFWAEAVKWARKVRDKVDDDLAPVEEVFIGVATDEDIPF